MKTKMIIIIGVIIGNLLTGYINSQFIKKRLATKDDSKYQDSVNWEKKYRELKKQVAELLSEHKQLKKYFEE